MYQANAVVGDHAEVVEVGAQPATGVVEFPEGELQVSTDNCYRIGSHVRLPVEEPGQPGASFQSRAVRGYGGLDG